MLQPESYSTAAASCHAEEMHFLLGGHGPRAALTHFYMGTFTGFHTFIFCAHKHPPPPPPTHTHTLILHLLPSTEPAPSPSTPQSVWNQGCEQSKVLPFSVLHGHLGLYLLIFQWPKMFYFAYLQIILKVRQSQ